jgi:hypothetical protein
VVEYVIVGEPGRSLLLDGKSGRQIEKIGRGGSRREDVTVVRATGRRYRGKRDRMGKVSKNRWQMGTPSEQLPVSPMVAGRGMGVVPREPSHVRETRTALEEIGRVNFLSVSRSSFLSGDAV